MSILHMQMFHLLLKEKVGVVVKLQLIVLDSGSIVAEEEGKVEIYWHIFSIK